MKAGDLRHLITIQAPPAASTVADAVGQRARGVWTDVGTYWASIEPQSGKDVSIGQQTQAVVTHRIGMRAVPGVKITPYHRVKYGSRVFSIVSALDVKERGIEIRILATEAAALPVAPPTPTP